MKEHHDNVDTINYTIGSNTFIAKKCPKSRTTKMKPIINLVMGFFVRSQSKTSKPKNNYSILFSIENLLIFHKSMMLMLMELKLCYNVKWDCVEGRGGSGGTCAG